MVAAFSADQTSNAKRRLAIRTRRGERTKDDWIAAEHGEIALAIIGEHYRSRPPRRRPSWSRARLAKLDQTGLQPLLTQAVGATSSFVFG